MNATDLRPGDRVTVLPRYRPSGRAVVLTAKHDVVTVRMDADGVIYAFGRQAVEKDTQP